ncbi:hypothetical protein KPL74_00820 [Bacillus sp. NP157]|nr:hypothetical protein KPL74_00820 [Bacillus sp. NP157]
MSLTINTNIMSLNAQRNLSTSQTKLSSAIERLSSGNRINSAKDDAAGLAISTRMTTQINGLNRAVQNANDGISLSQTTESALDEVTNNLQRIRELAVQSTNASNSTSDRAALDAEVQQRLSEVTRIATQTNFNGMKVLDGSAQNLSFQVGANVGEVITVGLDKGMKASQIGQLNTGSATPVIPAAAAATTGSAAVAGNTVMTGAPGLDYSGGDKTFKVGSATVTLTGTYATQADMLTDINSQLTGVTASVNGGNLTFTNNTAGAGAAPVIDDSADSVLGAQLSTTPGAAAVAAAPATTGGLTLAAGAVTVKVGDNDAFDLAGKYNSVQDLADAINAKSGQGINAYVSTATDGTQSLKFGSSSAITIGGTAPASAGFTAGAVGDSGKTLADSSVKTVDGANETIERIDAALQSVSSLRSDLGAVQNRFESTISNLQNISQNLTSSKSAITDADFAQETANMSSAQILQQAGVSVLATANSSQQIVTKLLG